MYKHLNVEKGRQCKKRMCACAVFQEIGAVNGLKNRKGLPLSVSLAKSELKYAMNCSISIKEKV